MIYPIQTRLNSNNNSQFNRPKTMVISNSQSSSSNNKIQQQAQHNSQKNNEYKLWFIQFNRTKRLSLSISKIKGKSFTFYKQSLGFCLTKRKVQPRSCLLIKPSEDTQTEKIKTNQWIELLQIYDEIAQSKTCINEIFKHVNILTHLYLPIRHQSPFSFVTDSHHERDVALFLGR